ncbi:hypothetical protein RRSWK_06849 [Rhodopirellula sp. SWK7]|nr:hypothetical protein RRSWK_06849 [Rhodopirellula sp. SWK7]
MGDAITDGSIRLMVSLLKSWRNVRERERKRCGLQSNVAARSFLNASSYG